MAEKPKADQMLTNIVNKQPFSYDAAADPLYQAYKKEYQALGDKSKADTLKDVGMLNGSSAVADYAQIAAAQAQNTYRQQMSTIIPALEEAAYGRWKGQMQKAQADYGLVRDEENTLYGRRRDSIADSQFAKQAAWQRSTWNKDFNYGKRRDSVSDKQWKDEFGWQKTMDNREYELNKKQLAKQRRRSSGGGYRSSSGGRRSTTSGYVGTGKSSSSGKSKGNDFNKLWDKTNKGKEAPKKSPQRSRSAIATVLTDGWLGYAMERMKKK